jgi:hypothetical protein
MIRKTKVLLIQPDLKKRCKGEGAESIRDLLSQSIDNSLVVYTNTKDDHRYHQGYLQALVDLHGTITTT